MGDVEKIIDSLPFRIKSYKRGNDDKGFIFVDVSDEMAILTENITTIQQLGALKHAQAHKGPINELEQDMNQILEIIEVWIEVQKKWMYLESIFVGSEDIRQKLPDEAKEFDKNDKKFRLMMGSVNKKPSIKAQCKEPNKKSDLKMILKNLEESLGKDLLVSLGVIFILNFIVVILLN
jgi:dynein heavy chain